MSDKMRGYSTGYDKVEQSAYVLGDRSEMNKINSIDLKLHNEIVLGLQSSS